MPRLDRPFSLRGPPGRRLRSLASASEDRLRPGQIVLGVDPDGVPRRVGDMNVDAVLEKAKLFQTLDLFQTAGGERSEACECRLAVGIDAQMLAEPAVTLAVLVV